jgi:hypothetical protein
MCTKYACACCCVWVPVKASRPACHDEIRLLLCLMMVMFVSTEVPCLHSKPRMCRHRTKSTQPWLGRKPASLRSDMKTIIADFKRSAKLREMEERDDMLLRGIGGSFPASATEADSKQQAPVLEDSDRMLAQNIYITDMQANMYQLKRAIASEQQRFKNEITKAQIEVETVNQREVELNAQNSFLRDAILEGRLGNAINVQRFQELYEEIVRAEADYEQNSGDIKEWDELSPASSPKLQTNRCKKSVQSFCKHPRFPQGCISLVLLADHFPFLARHKMCGCNRCFQRD